MSCCHGGHASGQGITARTQEPQSTLGMKEFGLRRNDDQDNEC